MTLVNPDAAVNEGWRVSRGSMRDVLRYDALRYMVWKDIEAHPPPSYRTVARLLYQSVALRAVAWFRFGYWLQSRGVRVLPMIIQRHLLLRYGLDIVISTPIDGGLYIPHPVGTVIAARRIGRNCSIIASVTIGMRNTWEFPEIGDRVFIGAGARVLGGIRIGNDAVIGANAVVIDNVPDGATVVGTPARGVRSYGKPL